MCSIGSFFSSGSPESIKDDGQVDRSKYPVGMGERDWKYLTKKVIENLQYIDGGGLTINHPTWSSLSLENIYKILDYAPQILGIQACNTDLASDLEYWDNVLKTGRKAWGFFVPDHKHKSKPNGDWRGRNILLIPELTEHACLQSYRNGSFFGQLYNTDLSFIEISLSDKTVTYITNFAESIKIIEDGIITEYQGNSCTHVCQNDVTYVRAEAAGLNDKIYSQPIIFKLYTPPKKDTIFGQKKSKQINNMWW